jgi:hypothetical protein
VVSNTSAFAITSARTEGRPRPDPEQIGDISSGINRTL